MEGSFLLDLPIRIILFVFALFFSGCEIDLFFQLPFFEPEFSHSDRHVIFIPDIGKEVSCFVPFFMHTLFFPEDKTSFKFQLAILKPLFARFIEFAVYISFIELWFAIGVPLFGLLNGAFFFCCGHIMFALRPGPKSKKALADLRQGPNLGI